MSATSTIKTIFTQGIIITGLCLSGSAVEATPRAIDSFSSNTRPLSSASAQTGSQKPAVGAAAQSMASDQTPALAWFEKFDALQQKYRPSDSDKVILVRPLMQEAERVRQWKETANKVAQNYRILAKSLRALPAPAGMNDIKEYSNLTSDWYEDAASVYVDLIRPRRPAKTIEELQDSVNTIKKKSDSLSSTIANLRQMDFSLRRNYKVHLAMQDDALQQFVRGK